MDSRDGTVRLFEVRYQHNRENSICKDKKETTINKSICNPNKAKSGFYL